MSNIAPKASASWLSEATEISFETYQSSDPSIGFDANGTMHYTYTAFVPQANDFEIAYYNNSAGDDFIVEFEYLSDGEGLNSINSTANGYSQIFLDNNTIHAVWQGKNTTLLGSDFEIFYTNSSNGNIKDYATWITSDAGESTNPTIVVINETVFVAYADSTSGDIRMKTNYGSNTLKGAALDPTSGAAGTMPQMTLWKNNTDWRIDLVYLNAANNLVRTYLRKGQDPATAFSGNTQSALVVTATDFSTDSSKDGVFVCLVQSNEIYVANATSSGFGSAVRVTNNALVEGDPDIIVNENNIATIFYVTNASDGNSTIRTRNNYNTYFTKEESLINKAQIASNVVSLKIMSLDAEMCQGEGVFIIYQTTTKAGPTETKNVLRLNSYGTIYNDGTGNFNYYNFEEILGGKVFSEGWLIEGIEISYNTSSGNDVYLKLRLTDTITKVVWENISKFDGNGGKDYQVRFFQPENYFIARNPFRFEILNGSSQQDLVKIELDPLTFSNQTANWTSNEGQSGFAYTLQSVTGESLESTIFIADNLKVQNNIWLKNDALATSNSLGTLDANNFVDVYKFNMLAGDQYNMSLTTIGTGSQNCSILVFNSTAQITNAENALYNFNTSTHNNTYFQVYSPTDDVYYVVIEKTAFNAAFTYTFKHKISPMTARLITLSENQYTSQEKVQFTWDLNSLDTFTISDISFFRFELYNAQKNPVHVTFYKHTVPAPTTNINITLIGGSSPGQKEYNLADGIYYWKLIIVSKTSQESKGIFTKFNLDTTPPEAPVILSIPNEYYTLGEFTVWWTTPSDGPFTVDHYEMYRGYSSSFECDSNTRLGLDQAGNTYFEYGMDTGIYYYRIIAVDHAGLKSDPSIAGMYIVSVGGVVEPFDQEFQILPGDYLEYQLTDVYEEGNKDPNNLYATIHGKEFQLNTMFYYYITIVNKEQVIPVRADWYYKWMNTTAEQIEEEYELIGTDMDVFPLVTSPDREYQGDIFELFVERELGNHSRFEHEVKGAKYYNWLTTIDAVVHTFYIPIDYEAKSAVDYYYDSVVFVVDKRTGVVLEMTVYNNYDNIGYSLKLINTSVGLSKIEWWIVPLIIIAALGIVAAVLNQIIKKMERRV